MCGLFFFSGRGGMTTHYRASDPGVNLDARSAGSD
jgi:hypothetical protein